MTRETINQSSEPLKPLSGRSFYGQYRELEKMVEEGTLSRLALLKWMNREVTLMVDARKPLIVKGDS